MRLGLGVHWNLNESWLKDTVGVSNKIPRFFLIDGITPQCRQPMMIVPTAFVPTTVLTAPTLVHRVSAATTSTSLSMGLLPSGSTGSTVASILLPTVMSVAGGGLVDVNGQLDMSRVRLRLEGLQAYGTISALLILSLSS